MIFFFGNLQPSVGKLQHCTVSIFFAYDTTGSCFCNGNRHDTAVIMLDVCIKSLKFFCEILCKSYISLTVFFAQGTFLICFISLFFTLLIIELVD